SRRSGRRPGKEVVVEPDNDDKYIDVNDEPSDDDFVDLGRNSAYASGKKSLHGCLDNGLNCDRIHYCLRRSRRNKDKEVYDSDHAKIVASGSKVNDKTESVTKQKQGNKKKLPTGENSLSAVLQTRSSPRVLCNAMLQLKPNQKACLEEIGFGGMVEFKVDGIPSKLGLYVVDNFDENKMEIKLYNGSIVLTKDMIGGMLGLKNKGLDILEGNPNRDDEMVRNWKQQYGDSKEIKPGDVKMRMRKSNEADLNFKLNFIVLFTSIIENIPLKTCKKGWKKGKKDSYFRGPLTVLTGCIWMLNNYEKNITKEQKGFEKLLTVAEHMFPGNVNLIRVEALNDVGFRAQRNEEVEVGVGYIGVNEQTHGFGKDLIGLTKNSCTDVVVEQESLFGFDRQENMCGVLTQKAFVSVADEVKRSIENLKIMEIDDRPSFSFGVTQDFDVIPGTNNEKKVLTPMSISAYTPEGEASDVFTFHGKRVTSKSNIMSIERLLNSFANQPNETNTNDLESDDGSVNTPLVYPFPYSDNDSDDEEILNVLIEYENAGTLRQERIINSFDGDDLVFECMIGFRKFTAYLDPFLPMNIISRKAYNTIIIEGLEGTGKNLVAIVKDVYVFVRSFTYITDFVVLEDIGEFIMSDMAEVLMGRRFRKIA
ncbi:hypothetical protein Tco_1203878, partial [Tanacetum coccineum]